MADWRKWPLQKAKIPDPSTLPFGGRGREIVREIRQDVGRSIVPELLAIAIPAGAGYGLFKLFASDGEGLAAMVIALSSLGALVASSLWVSRGKQELAGKRRSRRVLDFLEARGESVLGDEVVGVTYSDNVWRDSLAGDSWDWGALRLDMDRLSFVGRHSRFDLRPESILSLELRRLAGSNGPQARLFLTWEAEGRIENLILELPYQRATSRRMNAAQSLCERIDRWRREPLPSHDKTPMIPPPRQDELRPAISRFALIGPPAKILAGVAVLVFGILFNVSFSLLLKAVGFGHYSGILSGTSILYIFAWLWLAPKIEKRLPVRWQSPEKEPILPTFDLGLALPNEDAESVEPVRRDP